MMDGGRGGKPEASRSVSIPVQPIRSRTFEDEDIHISAAHRQQRPNRPFYPRHRSRDFEDEEREEKELSEKECGEGAW